MRDVIEWWYATDGPSLLWRCVMYDDDYCKHGVYVGGCGIDWMCGKCEGGE